MREATFRVGRVEKCDGENCKSRERERNSKGKEKLKVERKVVEMLKVADRAQKKVPFTYGADLTKVTF